LSHGQFRAETAGDYYTKKNARTAKSERLYMSLGRV